MRDRFWQIKFYIETHKIEVRLAAQTAIGVTGILAGGYALTRSSRIPVRITPEWLEYMRTAEEGTGAIVKTPFLQPNIELIKVPSRK